MPQAVEVVGKAEQEGLANLGGQAASGSARGELAFDRRENAFDLGALAVRYFRKGSEHLIPNGAVGDTPAPRGNDALRPQALPNVLVVGFGVKLRIRQHHTEGSASCRHIEQSRQRTRVTPGPLTGSLRQQNLLLHIHHNQPLQPRTTRLGPVRMLLQTPEEEGADGSIGEPRAVDGCRNGSAPASPQPTHGFLQSAIDGVVLQPPQKTIQRGVIWHRWQFQYGTQLLVLLQAHLGFAKSPVFKAHQAQHRQQLRLGELMFAEARAVGRQNLRGHLQRHASKGQESNLGHRPSCLIRKHRKPLLVDLSQRELCRGCQQSPSVAYKRLTAQLNSLDATFTKNTGEGLLTSLPHYLVTSLLPNRRCPTRPLEHRSRRVGFFAGVTHANDASWIPDSCRPRDVADFFSVEGQDRFRFGDDVARKSEQHALTVDLAAGAHALDDLLSRIAALRVADMAGLQAPLVRDLFFAEVIAKPRHPLRQPQPAQRRVSHGPAAVLPRRARKNPPKLPQ